VYYQTTSPVLFIIFNRPDTTRLIFDEIKKARPAKLYIAADGPREDREGENVLCSLSRSIIEQIDWDCQVSSLYQIKNLGCKNAVASAIDWFFEKEDEGIILEDDCLPANEFFRFCDTLLTKYRYDSRIRHIGGCNLQSGIKRGDASYYFSNMTHVWGWASWKRAWIAYDRELSNYNINDVPTQLGKIFSEPLIIETWTNIFMQVKNKEVDTWDYQLTFTNFFNNGLSAMPNVNLITNIGFRQDATHTKLTDSNANIPLGTLDSKITHPLYFLPDKEADTYTLTIDFLINERKAELERKNKWLRRTFKRWLSSIKKAVAN